MKAARNLSPSRTESLYHVSGGSRGTDDVRINRLGPLMSPMVMMEMKPLDDRTAEVIKAGRQQVREVVHGQDDRMLVVVGPCSVHDPKAAIEYAGKLKMLKEKYQKDLLLVMRVYFEKPRTTVGWKGLINDPELTGSFKINQGLGLGRQLLLDINKLGVPCGCEFLDVVSPQWLADLVSWGAIGARTTESQVHRELASGLSMPVGFKNSTAGNIQIASDAIRSSRQPHAFLSVTKQGLAAIVHTNGNPDTHVILRGGHSGPNFDASSVLSATTKLKKDGANSRLMIDCSHGNSRKIHTNQKPVAADVASQVASGNRDIIGVMIESNLNAGKQKFMPGKDDPAKLKYGLSITDACVDIPTTDTILGLLAKAVRERRVLPKM